MKPWRYAIGEGAFHLAGTAVGTYLLFYYTDNLGLAAVWASVAGIVNAIWDGMNDPIVGHLSDRTVTRFGRRRPWLWVAIPLYLLFSLLCWLVPGGLSGVGLFIWYTVMLVAWETSSTMTWINYHSLLPAMFPTEEARLQTNTYKKAFGMVAMIAGFAVTPILKDMIGFLNTSLIFAAIAAVGSWLMMGAVREPKLEPAASQPGFFATLLATLRYTTYRWYLVVHAFTHLTYSILNIGMAFYAKYSLGLDGLGTSILFGSVFIATIPGMAFWAWVARKLDPMRACSISLFGFAVTVVGLGVAPDQWTAVAAGVAVGLSMSGFMTVGDVIISRIVDEDFARTGIRREGMFFSVIWVAARLANVLRSAAFALLAVMFGYVSGDHPGPEPGTAFRVLMGAIPAVGLAFAWLASLALTASFRRQAAQAGTTATGA